MNIIDYRLDYSLEYSELKTKLLERFKIPPNLLKYNASIKTVFFSIHANEYKLLFSVSKMWFIKSLAKNKTKIKTTQNTEKQYDKIWINFWK